MLLHAKHALVFAATGAIGSGVARRFAQEGATVKAAAFLASDHASGMTGQVVTVCGGVFVG